MAIQTHMANLSRNDQISPERPIEIANKIWWVGHYLENEPFQCHVYLLEHGDQSVLFDPGSNITFKYTKKKIEQVTPFSNIRYFVCHHQDPDITSCMPEIDQLIEREDALLITHWRTKVLLKHYDLKIPFWLIEKNDWRLDLGGRELEFTFTPYVHFAGAFTTFDRQSGILFSSDIFGGFTDGFKLYAEDESYFDSLKPFHEHYIPSREVLNFSLNKFEKFPLKLIAPQHGSIIPEPLIAPIISQLKQLDCGLYLLSECETDINELIQYSENISDILNIMIRYRDFQDIATEVLKIVKRQLPLNAIEFFTCSDDGYLHLTASNNYKGVKCELPELINNFIGQDAGWWNKIYNHKYLVNNSTILLPLFTSGEGLITSVAVLDLESGIELNELTENLIEQMIVPLQVALERETIHQLLELQRQEFYQQSIKDPLTNLYTRVYMRDSIKRLYAMHDRDIDNAVAVVIFDIDCFKSINDTHGHNQGDAVLKEVAQVIINESRDTDMPVRLGGDELVLFTSGHSAREINKLAERIRLSVSNLKVAGSSRSGCITISGGTAIRKQHETHDAFLARADKALYQAKAQGRDRIYNADIVEEAIV